MQRSDFSQICNRIRAVWFTEESFLNHLTGGKKYIECPNQKSLPFKRLAPIDLDHKIGLILHVLAGQAI